MKKKILVLVLLASVLLTGSVGESMYYQEQHHNQILRTDQTYDAGAIYSSAMIEKEGLFYLFYGSASSTAVDLKHDFSISMAIGSSPFSFSKYPLNPIIDRKTIGLSANGSGIAPFDIKKFDGIYYLYCTLYQKNHKGQFVVFQSADLYQWSNYTVILSDANNNFAPYIYTRPSGSTEMYYCYEEPGETNFKIGKALGFSPTMFVQYSGNPIFATSENTPYPFVDTVGGYEYLYYAKKGSGINYSIYRTRKMNGEFKESASELILSPSP